MKLIVQNLATEYKDEGEGKTLLFLHGWQDSLSSFNQVAALLKDDYRIVSLDLPGFGATEAPKTTWELSNYIQFVQEFIAKLGIDASVIIGHSFGGRIAIKGVSEGKLRPTQIVLIGSAGFVKSNTLKNSVIKMLTKVVGFVMYIPPLLFIRTAMRKKLYKAIGSDYLDAGPLQKTFLNVIGEDLSVYASKIAVPTLLMWGSNDTQTPLKDGQILTALIPQSELKVIDKAGHFVHNEEPEEVSRMIKEFVC